MLDAKRIRANPEEIREGLSKRRADPGLVERFLAADERRRQNLAVSEEQKSRRNKESENIARMKKAGEDAGEAMALMKALGEEIRALDERLREIEDELRAILLSLPNMPHASVPAGEDEAANAEIRRWGTPRAFDFPALAHWEIGEALNILDPERAAKVTGARFMFYRGLGALLERALIGFMLDLHTQSHGYEELLPPFMVNRESMIGTGQLPKFAEDMFRLEGGQGYYLIPTAEVPVTNYYREEILEAGKLPLYHCAYTPCFRAESGAAGRDTRGLIRLHQFNKVELVKFVLPERSYEELEALTANAEEVLRRLELPYRVVALATGDLGFSAAKTYDLEVWLPSAGVYREISSCSNFEDFQARRANIRFRREPKARPEFVHTLNGSGLAVGRTVAAVLENCQNADGSVTIPQALRPYMGGREKIPALR
ncbi:MAG: serine--tRNA ligase [Peptococcaceae bacterium]|jgi:seryl-tRNA synthetase|nr:serine--tRNA ligase [Peptococcaceae bacterium]